MLWPGSLTRRRRFSSPREKDRRTVVLAQHRPHTPDGLVSRSAEISILHEWAGLVHGRGRVATVYTGKQLRYCVSSKYFALLNVPKVS